MKFDTDKFSKAIRAKRTIFNDLTMKHVAKKTKVSPATLSRLENGKLPDVETYAKVCKWLDEKMERFFI